MLDVAVSLRRGGFFLKAEIHDSGFVCLSGPNGSGKSTLLNVIAGTIRTDSGYVRINSKDITKLPIEERGVVLVNPGSLIPHLEVDKHLTWGAAAKKIPVALNTLASVKRKLGIDYHGRVDQLSQGMRERVSLATAFLAEPEVILVDEAFANLDNRNDLIRAFADLCREKSIDLVSTTQEEGDAKASDHHYRMMNGVTSRAE